MAGDRNLSVLRIEMLVQPANKQPFLAKSTTSRTSHEPNYQEVHATRCLWEFGMTGFLQVLLAYVNGGI